MGVSNSVVDLYPALANTPVDSLEAMGVAAELWLERVLGRKISAQAITETLSGCNNPLLFLSSPPVVSIESITISSYSNQQTYTADSNYYSFTKNGIIHINPQGFWQQLPGWRPGVGNIVVNYTTEGLSQVTIDLLVGAVMNWWQQQAEKSVLASKETIMSYSYEMRTDFKGIPPAVWTLIAPYMTRFVV